MDGRVEEEEKAGREHSETVSAKGGLSRVGNDVCLDNVLLWK